ncbi:hypothetical protein N9P64_00410 [bacterium]|nr:hypothetical protein [bacterium]
MYKKILLFISFLLYLSCIGTDVTDDYVDPTLRITSPQIISIKVGQKFQFTAKYFDTSGTPVDNPNLIWTVSPPDALTIDDNGFATATKDGLATIQVSVVTALGTTISAETSFPVREVVVITETATMTTDTATTTSTTSGTTSNTTDSNTSTSTTGSNTATTTTNTATSTTNTSTTIGDDDVVVTAPQSYQGTIQTTSSYVLTGSYEYGINDAGQLVLDIGDDYEASTAIPRLFVYLTNNPNSPSGGYEIGEVTVFSGAHSYILPSSIDINDYKYILYWCKPYIVKVGDSTIF